MESIVLLFETGMMKAGQIKNLCDEYGLRMISVPVADYNQRLGALAGYAGVKREDLTANSDKLPGEMMVFSGVDSDELEDFLDEYKEKGIAPIVHKAVLTPYNLMWTPIKLYKALDSEAESIG